MGFLDEHAARACIHCGLCLGSCPTYRETGDENESPRGRIWLMRQLAAGRLSLTAGVVGPLDRCLGCRACEVACPSGVAYGALLEQTRAYVERGYRRRGWQWWLRRVLIDEVLPYPQRLRVALWPVGLARWWGRRGGLPAWLREPMELLPERWDDAPLPAESPACGPRRGRVGLLTGCVMSVLFRGTHRATMRLLNWAGYDVVVPEGQVCCGALHAHNGNLVQARHLARRNVAVFVQSGVDWVVVNAAGCGAMMKEYGHLLGDEEAMRVAGRVRDLVELLATREFPQQGTKRVTYHEACHLSHAQRIRQQPRELLRAVAGRQFVELPESDTCCGSAGSYNLTEPDMARRLQQRKVENILRSGACVVVTTNPGCQMQIEAGLRRAGARHVRVQHLADYLVERLRLR
ncbi:MAG: (Fe-S)-binding protein [Verrucomicrobiae bacterium]|nr:(Fe-S)-binding protein [Verrucomicrobiae bacterium]